MKKIIASSLLCSALVYGAVTDDQTRIGVGVGLSDGSSTVRMPLDIQKDLRIEPELGIGFQSKDNDDRTSFLIGAGLYMMNQPSGKINLYYGGKLMIDYESYDYGNGNDDSTTEIKLGGVFGFEYMLDYHFSAGGEAGAYLGFGNATTLNTQGMALLRYYF